MLWTLSEEWEHLAAQVLVCIDVWGTHGMPGAALCRRDSCSTHRKTSPKLKQTWDRLLLFLMPQPGVMPLLASQECPVRTCSVNPLVLGYFSFDCLCLYWWHWCQPTALEQPEVTCGVLGGWAVMWGLWWDFFVFCFNWHLNSFVICNLFFVYFL